MESDGSVGLYIRCHKAWLHFNQHYGNIQLYRLSLNQNTETNDHCETLKEVERYLQQTHRQSQLNSEELSCEQQDAEHALINMALATLEDVLKRRILMAARVLSALSNTKTYLFEDMDAAAVGKLVQGVEARLTAFLLSESEYELHNVQCHYHRLTKQHEEETNKSIDDVREDIVVNEYQNNKDLNKFEFETDLAVRAKAAEKLDEAWGKHLQKVGHISTAKARAKNDLLRWKEKIQILKIALSRREPTTDCAETTPALNSIAQITSQQKSREHSSLIANIETSPADESPVDSSSNPVTANFTEPTIETGASINTDIQADEDKTNNTYVVKMPSQPGDILRSHSPHNLGALRPTAASYINKSTKSIESSACSGTPSSSTQGESLVFIGKRARDDVSQHNKENIPIASFPFVQKELRKNAFAGIDEYARELFSKSPSPRPHEISRRTKLDR